MSKIISFDFRTSYQKGEATRTQKMIDAALKIVDSIITICTIGTVDTFFETEYLFHVISKDVKKNE
jgi:hypothetical protein